MTERSGSGTSCPAWYYADSGDLADALECELPIEHNIDGTRHRAEYSDARATVTAEWEMEPAWRLPWPRPYNPLSSEIIAAFTPLMVERIFRPSMLSRLDGSGKTIRFPRMPSLTVTGDQSD
jgi:hypothetical protein